MRCNDIKNRIGCATAWRDASDTELPQCFIDRLDLLLPGLTK